MNAIIKWDDIIWISGAMRSKEDLNKLLKLIVKF